MDGYLKQQTQSCRIFVTKWSRICKDDLQGGSVKVFRSELSGQSCLREKKSSNRLQNHCYRKAIKPSLIFIFSGRMDF